MEAKTVSRGLLGVVSLIFALYFLDRLSASSRVPIDVISVPDLVMFPLLLFMAFLVGAIFMIESQFVHD